MMRIKITPKTTAAFLCMLLSPLIYVQAQNPLTAQDFVNRLRLNFPATAIVGTVMEKKDVHVYME